ncbi:MAG: flagellar export protein FliJ [Candidatus Gastranaerophilales bacterium]|nr:flagellar export protein FliJ [Candidatus Gastranaerophilales bacterium]
MKKFKFSLQSLLDLREKRLEEKQIEYGKLQFIMRTLQTELMNLQNELVTSKENLCKLLNSNANIDINIIGMNRNYLLKLEEDIVNQDKKIEKHQIKLDEKQQEMLEALKEKTMLEKLKEKQLKEFLKTIDAAERKELDEIGLMRYAK